MGIEPTQPAWKAGVLPLNYTRKNPLQYRRDKYSQRYNTIPHFNLFVKPFLTGIKSLCAPLHTFVLLKPIESYDADILANLDSAQKFPGGDKRIKKRIFLVV